MRPVLRGERMDDRDTRRVALLPSHEGGHFLINHEYYGKVALSEVVLQGVTESDKDALEATGELSVESYVTTDEHGVSFAVNNFGATIPIGRGSGNSVSMTVESFQEFAPLNARVSANA